jgi:hypothetical protein
MIASIHIANVGTRAGPRVLRTTAEMRAFATGGTGPAHPSAIRADRAKEFTSEKDVAAAAA